MNIDATAASRKEIAKILMAIANKDQKVDSWVHTKFGNPAHPVGDVFQLKHWIKSNEQDELYHFSKFNKKVDVVEYTDQEYRDVIAKSQEAGSTQDIRKWSRPDTDLLFHLCYQFQLRFIVITDRFNFEKTAEYRKKEEEKAVKFGQLQGSRRRDRKCKEKEAKK